MKPGKLAAVHQQTLAPIALTHHEARAQIRAWTHQSNPFTVNVTITNEGATIHLICAHQHFQFSDNLGRLKTIKSIPSLYQWLDKIVPYSHRHFINIAFQ